MSVFQRISYHAWFATMAVVSPMRALAADFGGPIPEVPGTPDPGIDIRQTVLNALKYVLSFLALAAVIFIIIAGIRLIVSQGEDEQKNKAKKTIIYVIVGLIVILLARVIVAFFTDTVPQNI